MQTNKDLKNTFQHAKMIVMVALFLLAFVYLASGTYAVKPEQRGLVERFGEIVEDNVQPGIHYHLPWPIEKVSLIGATEVRSLVVQFKETSSTDKPEIGGALLTGDENIVLVTVTLQYKVKNPKHYMIATKDADKLLSRVTQSLAVEEFAGMSVDDVLTTGRQLIQSNLKRNIQKAVDKIGLGIRLTSAQIKKVEPPKLVARAFKDVASAREDKQKMVRQAEGERNKLTPEARAEANSMIRDAEGYAQEAVEIAKGDSKRFISNWMEYKKAKSVTAYRIYMETIEQILPNIKKHIVNPDAEKKVMNFYRK